MLNLPEETYSAFMSGKFPVRQKSGVFNGIWSDMATEKTIIKDSKGSGGIVGLTTQKSALLRWTFTRHFLARYASEMKKRSGIALGSDEDHEENRPTAMKRDEQQVNDLIEHVQNNMTDPFDIEEFSKSLINIATGLHASREVEDSLLNSVERGQKSLKPFVDGCFKDNETRDFYSPISKSSLKTFDDMTKPCNLKCRSGDIVKTHINPVLVFRRALALANVRDEVTV
ncbi:unnamed protein product [Mytilus coruscus]|uniref:Uncharacterized protein n=1 Tax=Mytilus coruscus TaxID=42192 RepID=A0A6J8DC56_MYTCO|nr:unnamed protein product [Mytilus coruscus]